MVSRIRLLVAALWAGSLWTVGYLVAPTLFATVSDRVLAGTIAASMFNIEAWVSIGCALAMLVLIWLSQGAAAGGGIFASAAAYSAAQARRMVVLIVVVMLGCTLVSHFGLQPMMASLRAAAGPGGVMEAAAKGQFGMLHGVSSGIYLVQSLLAAWLLVKQ